MLLTASSTSLICIKFFVSTCGGGLDTAGEVSEDFPEEEGLLL
jgi:hypothetical protein